MIYAYGPQIAAGMATVNAACNCAAWAVATDQPEDVDTEHEDHAPDEIRYAAMARPWVPNIRTVPKPAFVWRAQPDGSIISGVTMNEIIRRLERQAKRRAA